MGWHLADGLSAPQSDSSSTAASTAICTADAPCHQYTHTTTYANCAAGRQRETRQRRQRRQRESKQRRQRRHRRPRRTHSWQCLLEFLPVSPRRPPHAVLGSTLRQNLHRLAWRCWGVLLGKTCIATGEVRRRGEQKSRLAYRWLITVNERARAIVNACIGRFACMPPLGASLAQRGLSSSPPFARPQHARQRWGVLHGKACQRVSSAPPRHCSTLGGSGEYSSAWSASACAVCAPFFSASCRRPWRAMSCPIQGPLL